MILVLGSALSSPFWIMFASTFSAASAALNYPRYLSLPLTFSFAMIRLVLLQISRCTVMGGSIVPPCESVWLPIEADLTAADFCLACPEFYQAVGHHGRWSWENPTCSFHYLEWIDESQCKVPIVQWFPSNIKSLIFDLLTEHKAYFSPSFKFCGWCSVFTHCLAAGNLVGVALNYIFLLCHLSQACLTSNFNQCFYYSIVISLLSSPPPPIQVFVIIITRTHLACKVACLIQMLLVFAL